MSYSIFGWSYPPGCSGPPDDDDGACLVCGEMIDNCICPECPECGEFGNPDCYVLHGLRRTEQQKFYLEVNKRLQAKYFDDYFNDKDEIDWEE